MQNALLVYPEFPPSYWSQKHALRFIGKKAVLPPLGLLSVAALFPQHYRLTVVDMNIRELRDEDIDCCDVVFVSAMVVQRASFIEVVKRCRDKGKKIVAGGPYPTSFHEEIEGVDHVFVGEAEQRFDAFLKEIELGTALEISDAPYSSSGCVERPDLSGPIPLPRYDLINITDYASLAIQFSRGCPYNCEFCDITNLFGHISRSKSNSQILAELQQFYTLGFRGAVFFVDDNFIGNRNRVRSLLPVITEWQQERDFPFTFYTEASVNLAEMPELMNGMAGAGFDMVFLGIETPNSEVLQSSNKGHNVKKDNPDYLEEAVHRIQACGMEVSAGFIVGLDGDEEGCFDAQFEFIQRVGIPMAMVGLLTALRGTALYSRLESEGRLLSESSGDNVSIGLNYIPQMDAGMLIAEYKQLLSRLYNPNLSNYFKRCEVLLSHWKKPRHTNHRFSMKDAAILFRSFRLQVLSRQGIRYLLFLFAVLRERPKMLPEAVRLAILGYHYEMVTRQLVMVHDFKDLLQNEIAGFRTALERFAATSSEQVADMQAYLYARFDYMRHRYRKIDKQYRSAADEAVQRFRQTIEASLLDPRYCFVLEVPNI